MGRPPCCDKEGIKKGPWTPEEDIILVSYIQEHGPGNWRSVPTNTGLLRCSKSCRLRWTNYLRPGIKRGNFTPHEEGMIIHLQALLGNKWAAIASYLPQRTDNDIKNYWNTHLKKKMKKFQSPPDSSSCNFMSSSSDEKRNNDIATTANASSTPPALGLNQGSSTYASSAENISRLLEGWMRSSPKNTKNTNSVKDNQEKIHENMIGATGPIIQGYRPKLEQEGGDLISNEEYESILSFDNLNTSVWDKMSCDSSQKGSQNGEEKGFFVHERKQRGEDNNPPLTYLEKWLLDETSAQVEEILELPSMF